MKLSREFRVGAFAVLCIAILYFGFNYLKGIDFFKKSEKYYVIYNDVAGLAVSNPVKISGFTVGRVSSININQKANNTIAVELDIASDIIIGDSTTALLDVDLLGSVSIILDIGDIEHPLEPGDTVLARVDPSLTELLTTSALPVADNLQITIRRFNELLADFSENSESLKQTIDNMAAITAQTSGMLAENRQNIKATTEGFVKLTSKLNDRMDELSTVMTKYGGVADSLMAIDLQSTLDETSLLMQNMNELLTQLQSDEGTLGKFMKDDSVYTNLNQVLVDLDQLLIHMNENPKHFFGPLGKSRKKIERDLEKQAKENN